MRQDGAIGRNWMRVGGWVQNDDILLSETRNQRTAKVCTAARMGYPAERCAKNVGHGWGLLTVEDIANKYLWLSFE